MNQPDRDSQAFDSYPSSAEAYVTWVDIMGAGQLMQSSLQELAGRVTDLTSVCRTAAESGVGLSLHPLNDGIFGLATDRAEALNFLRRVFTTFAAHLPTARPPSAAVLIRGAVAHGEVVAVRQRLPTHTTITLLGPAKSAAFRVEDDAAPFGVQVHQSAVSTGVPADWRWYAPEEREPVLVALENHYAWLRDNAATYRPARLAEHLARVRSYFAAPTY